MPVDAAIYYYSLFPSKDVLTLSNFTSIAEHCTKAYIKVTKFSYVKDGYISFTLSWFEVKTYKYCQTILNGDVEIVLIILIHKGANKY